ncbi:AAA family ATPase [Planococcus sp. YIM B11945]|uniref:AAA family ATPase n=1 Tax=Planococcus sp. YIM B11945 TaxID=3435410 RepID=UPI003D7E4985
MKFILLFGPQAAGKMTIGQELEKMTGLKLFHNHMTIDLLYPFFGFSPEMWRLADLFRKEIFQTVAGSEVDGMIFTYVWTFDMQEDWDFVENTVEIFESQGDEVYFVELEADMEVRLERNKTGHRLEHKPTKRNIEESEKNLKESMKIHRLNSLDGEIKHSRYMRIDNTNLRPEETAEIIRTHFGL